MAIILRGAEREGAQEWMDRTVEISMQSPCQRDKRGVIIVNHGKQIGAGVNAPPLGFSCEPKYCIPTCKDYAVHAEMNAIADATRRGDDLMGSRMYHARAENGVLIPSRKPKCYQCSKHILTFGLSEFVLMHEEGLVLYNVAEFNKLSLDAIQSQK